MIQVFRIAAGLVIGLFGLVLGFSLYALMQSSTYEPSLDHQRQLHSDFMRIGQYVEDERVRTGRLPSNDDLRTWASEQRLSPRLIIDNISIVPTYDTCVLGEKTKLPSDGHTYRLCYWNNWTEEYAPQTKAHTFALSFKDFEPPWWEVLLFAAFAIGALFISYRLLRLPDNRKMHPA